MKSNGIYIFPTDTVYGIGASVYNKEAMQEIYRIKKRDLNKPLAVLCANYEQITDIAYVDDKAKKVINKYFPGALTIILKSKPVIVSNMNIETVGIRIPNSKIACDILLEKGPLATTSVNESGFKPLNSYQEILLEYQEKVEFVYSDENNLSSNMSSTVIKMVDGKIELIREGEIQFQEILNICE